VTFTLPKGTSQNISMTLHDLRGSQYTVNPIVSLFPHGTAVSIRMKDLPNGFYKYQLFTEDEVYSGDILKQ